MRSRENAQRYLKLTLQTNQQPRTHQLNSNPLIVAAYPKLLSLDATQITKLSYKLVRYGDLLDIVSFFRNNYIESIAVSSTKPTHFKTVNSGELKISDLSGTLVKLNAQITPEIERRINSLLLSGYCDRHSPNELFYFSETKTLGNIFYHDKDRRLADPKFRAIQRSKFVYVASLRHKLAAKRRQIERSLGHSIAALELITTTL